MGDDSARSLPQGRASGNLGSLIGGRRPSVGDCPLLDRRVVGRGHQRVLVQPGQAADVVEPVGVCREVRERLLGRAISLSDGSTSGPSRHPGTTRVPSAHDVARAPFPRRRQSPMDGERASDKDLVIHV